MGKRKSSSKPQGPKKSDPLPTTFLCLFCNHEDAVTVKINRRGGVGNLNCNICGQTFQCAINYLSAPVDVYSDWVDAADSVTTSKSGGRFTSRPAPKQQLDELADDDDY
ncbi:hypothetical protein BROUX41_000037 [Berkeleyomyces rouxiae]|uniref:uncharacterized protein n=1 Tax=Berkeleyomyces rouxiae TaxID=2035830 RepID=UPI003B7DAF1B